MTKHKLQVGDVIETKFKSTFVVIALLPKGKARIKFNDEFEYETVKDRRDVLSGNVKNPYHPRLFNKGYFGIGKFKARNGTALKGFPQTEEYRAWTNMLSRCYDPNYIQRNTGNRTYDGVSVCDEWLNFQTYAEWFTSNLAKIRIIEPDIRLAVDKDILSNSKVYSPETCSIIPMEVNSILTGGMSVLNGTRDKYAALNKDGTYTLTLFSKNNAVSKCINVKTIEESNKLYIEHKLSQLKELAEKYKHILEERVYLRMLNYS